MRVKIKEKTNIPKLEYGKNYEIKLVTCGWYYRFKFTRKKNIYYKEINRGCHVCSDIRITKKDLKKLINTTEFTECVVEADYSPDILCALFGDVEDSNAIAQLIKDSRYEVYLSRFYDVPSEIDTIEMSLETILNDLHKVELVINNIVEIWEDGHFRKCVGISLLGNYKEIKGEAVRSLYIIIN
ncbi:hypothetical protein D7X33_19360 [Butyricicoccus sp. 1XD8-22]|nr:hypothetical protein D7X33_19360 [Butyricicoccus sp. 1XD8-22]